MRSRANIFGHSIHQMLIVFPMGLLMSSFLFDILRGITGNGIFSHAAWWMMAVGGVLALVAAVFGLIDWSALPSGTRAKRVGVQHAVGNVFALVLFFVSWLLRFGTPANPPALAIVFSAAGVATLIITGWFGGVLVNRMGVGVEEGAHLDAAESPMRRGLQAGKRRPTETHP